MANVSDERSIRIAKVQKLRESGVNPYVERCNKTHSLSQARELPEGTKDVQLSARVMLKRSFGKLLFATLQDYDARMQIAVNMSVVEREQFKFFEKMIDTGDFVWVKGEIYKTEKGEITLKVEEFQLLSKAIRPLPEKFHGITDLETRSRQRYLDLIMNASTRERFKKRFKIINTIRNFLNDHDFVEVETPIILTKPSGALAKPFKTHHNALDIDMFLRIAPETYLKRCIAGGIERVYEFARSFRNEGMDPSHLQDFTLLEFYASYWNYEDNMRFTQELIKKILMEVNGSLELEYQGTKIDFSGEWPKYSFRELIINHAGIDIDTCPTKEELVAAIKAKNITLEGVDFDKIGRGNLIDQLYKKVARPSMINPQFLIKHPTDLSPLARKNDDDPNITDRFQLVVNSWEIVNAYSELVDPVEQRERLLAQARARENGDDEAMIMEEDFINCMEYGMPPISGWGMGIDRFTALLTDQENLREVVLFPLMKPLDYTADGEPVEENAEKTAESENLAPQDIADLGADKAKLDELFAEKLQKESLKNHSVASAAIMRGIAAKFGLNQENYYYAGLLHDVDFEDGEGSQMDKHGLIAAQWLKALGLNEDIVHAIMAHNEENGTKRETFLDYALTASETISGFITAVAKIYPDKKVASVKVSSVTKRMKEKAFASNVNRDSILLCSKIGLSLDEFVKIALESMKAVAETIGL